VFSEFSLSPFPLCHTLFPDFSPVSFFSFRLTKILIWFFWPGRILGHYQATFHAFSYGYVTDLTTRIQRIRIISVVILTSLWKIFWCRFFDTFSGKRISWFLVSVIACG
jgi:hypothetical protein